MDLYILIAILAIHYIADFFVQTQTQAENKSRDIGYLTYHVITYTSCFIPLMIFHLYGDNNLITIITKIFCASMFIFSSHWITDYFTSRASTKAFKISNRKGFQIVGLDQFIHYICLILTFLLI